MQKGDAVISEPHIQDHRPETPDGAPTLVVGATGTIGSTLVGALAAAGKPVRALVRNAARLPRVAGRVEVAVGDLTRPDTLRPAFDGARRVFVVTNDPTLEPAAFDAAVGAGVELLVKSSALGPSGLAPAGHAAAEAHLRESGVPWVVLRPNAFMQTLAQYLPPLIDVDGAFTLPAGSARTSWIDARDIADAAAAVLTDPAPATGRVWTLTGPASLSMQDIAVAAAAVSGRPVHYRPLDPDDALAVLRARLPAGLAAFLGVHYAAVRAGDFDLVTGDVEELCGRPGRSWRAFLDDHPNLF